MTNNVLAAIHANPAKTWPAFAAVIQAIMDETGGDFVSFYKSDCTKWKAANKLAKLTEGDLISVHEDDIHNDFAKRAVTVMQLCPSEALQAWLRDGVDIADKVSAIVAGPQPPAHVSSAVAFEAVISNYNGLRKGGISHSEAVRLTRAVCKVGNIDPKFVDTLDTMFG